MRIVSVSRIKLWLLHSFGWVYFLLLQNLEAWLSRFGHYLDIILPSVADNWPQNVRHFTSLPSVWRSDFAYQIYFISIFAVVSFFIAGYRIKPYINQRMKKTILHPKILNIDGESEYNMSSKMSTRALKNGYIEEPVSCNFFSFSSTLPYIANSHR